MRTVTEAEPDVGAQPLPEPNLKRIPRYAPDRAFPPYRYVPGSGQPHPVNDPRGHSYTDVRPPPHPEWTPHIWPVLTAWHQGVDLYNHWYFWEAHEAWEGLWQVADKGRAPALFVQALIQCAAAMLKVHLQSREGVEALWAGAQTRLVRVAMEHRELMGMKPKGVLKDMEKFFKPLQKGQLPTLQKGFPILKLDM
ncbi:MAG: DUF309 domain-containing protein [Myxococcota bacterium]